MADLKPRNLSQIKAKNPQLGECLEDIVSQSNNGFKQVNASPVGQTPPPPAHTALKVTAGNGFFSAIITANAPQFRGAEHFIDVSEDPNFGPNTVHQEHIGASTSLYKQYGPKTLHFRSYAAYPTSGPSGYVYANNVSGAGGTTPPVAGNGTGAGFGVGPFTTPTVPKR